jgi:hypothetical protein
MHLDVMILRSVLCSATSLPLEVGRGRFFNVGCTRPGFVRELVTTVAVS